jgi:ribosomal protein L1
LYDVFIKERIKQYDIAKKDLEREEREEISKALENKKEEAYKKFLADSAEWDIEKSKLKKRPDEPVESSIVLTKDEEKQVAAKSKFESIKYLVDQMQTLSLVWLKKEWRKQKQIQTKNILLNYQMAILITMMIKKMK